MTSSKNEANRDQLKLTRGLKAPFISTTIAQSKIRVQYKIYLPILDTNEKIATSRDMKTPNQCVEKGNVYPNCCGSPGGLIKGTNNSETIKYTLISQTKYFEVD